MATNIFLGNPPETIKQFIIENYGPKGDPMLKVPLHFTAEEPGATIVLRGKYEGMEDWNVDLWCDLQYSTDEMKTWKDYPKTVYSDEAIIMLDACENKTVYFKAKDKNNNFAFDGENAYVPTNYHQFEMTGSIKANGNIQFLLDNTGTKTDVPAYCYGNMFYNCTSLTQAPLLPATTLAEHCYHSMFSGCTSLTQAPALPATTTVEYCYTNMFSRCTSLTQAPELPAMTMAYECYTNMFSRCTSLTQAPILPATTLADYCYMYMFDRCTSLNNVNVSFSAWDPSSATYSWLKGVASTGTFTCPAALPDTPRDESHIPNGWTRVNKV